MKFTIERAAILKSLAHIQSVVERRNTIPILSNVLVRAGSDGLSLTATDMDITVVEKVSADVVQDGTTTAPAHTLYDLVRKLPEGAQIEVSSGGEQDQLALKSGRINVTLMTLSSKDFPAASDAELPNSFTLSTAELCGLIDRTRFAISTEETRYYLNGIYLHLAESEGAQVLRAVATDGHRLARVDIPLPEGAEGMPGVIVPRKAVTELRRLIEENDTEVKVALSDTRIRFEFDTVVLTSKLIDGTFPDYVRVIPSGNDKMLEVNCKSFTQAVDLVATISTERSRAVKLTLDRGVLVLSASSPDSGSATEELEVTYSAEPMEIGFNSRYLLDITQQIDGDEAQFTLADAASPTIVQDRADSSALYVLMPMRV